MTQDAVDSTGGRAEESRSHAETDEVIAIDGPAGSGKSTTARGVARALGWQHVESGAYYRAATLVGLREGLVDEGGVRGANLARRLGGMQVEFPDSGSGSELLLNGEPVGEALRSPEVTRLVSRVSADPDVRRVVTDLLRSSGRSHVVMDGRDIGTVVFPNARLKIFLDAPPEERARRRSAADGREVTPESLLSRDEQDRTRAAAPLLAAPDAVRLDTQGLTLEEQIRRIVELYRKRAGARP